MTHRVKIINLGDGIFDITCPSCSYHVIYDNKIKDRIPLDRIDEGDTSVEHNGGMGIDEISVHVESPLDDVCDKLFGGSQ